MTSSFLDWGGGGGGGVAFGVGGRSSATAGRRGGLWGSAGKGMVFMISRDSLGGPL